MQSSTFDDVIRMGSAKHYFTIAQNGTILEASTNVTGIPTELLLMTSVYDSLFNEDLPGFLCIKTQFWDRGHSGAEVYVRRRSSDGYWIWLLSRAVGFVDEGEIFAIIIEESLVDDIEAARRVNRTTKVLSLLIQAVEAAWLVGSDHANIGAQITNGSSDLDLVDETRIGANIVQQLTFDPDEVIDSLRSGVHLDLGLATLSTDDIRIITLVLSGRVSVQEVVPQIKNSLLLGFGLKGIIEQYNVDADKPTYRSARAQRMPLLHQITTIPPPISVLNLSYTFIGNVGTEILCEIIYKDRSCLKIVDLSFCSIEERGMVALSQALLCRRNRGIIPLKGLFLSGNYISCASAAALGSALAEAKGTKDVRVQKGMGRLGEDKTLVAMDGLLVLHVANASMTAQAACLLIEGLGANCNIREMNLASNGFEKHGAEVLSKVFEARMSLGNFDQVATLPFLERLDLSNNDFGDIGTTRISKALQTRKGVNFVDLKLSFNSIGSVGIESVMNNLLHHNLKSLSLDKNSIGDSGCQLVAASLLTMKSLCRLNLGFNQIGHRGITSLMRSLVTCESITYLGLSGNLLKISGSIALAFLLAQHPRLEELDVDNCCLDEASQCHIVAGIISNRLVPMKRLKGFSLGPPMVVIRALEPNLAQSNNEECLRIRLNEQMRTFLQWTEANRIAKQRGEDINLGISDDVVTDFGNARFLSPDFVARINQVHGAPSQNPYCRLLGWLSRIPFYEEELNALQKFFYDFDGAEGERGSDGYVNLRLRGDILAALDPESLPETPDDLLCIPAPGDSVGIDLDMMFSSENEPYSSAHNPSYVSVSISHGPDDNGGLDGTCFSKDETPISNGGRMNANELPRLSRTKSKMQSNGATIDANPTRDKEKKPKLKPRISLFPLFEQQLAELRSLTTDLIEKEEDAEQHEVILTQYAEAVLVILRQLRYLCMNCGLDGWRRSNLTRKILIVDDTLSTRKLVARAFENANFLVDTASNGVEGVKKLKESLYDIAFMDIEMPIMDGLEATKQLRAWEDENRPGARQPICALTGKDTNQKQLIEIKAAGIDVMEKKPCHIPRLFKVVDDVSPMFSDLSMNVCTLQREQSC